MTTLPNLLDLLADRHAAALVDLGPCVGDDLTAPARRSLGPSVGDDQAGIQPHVLGPCVGDDDIRRTV